MLFLVKKPLQNINGLSYRNELGEIITNQARALIEDLDKLPYPARDTLEYVKECGHSWPTQISSSRGCYGNCAFCDIRSFYNKKWRARDAVKVVDEMAWLNKKFMSKIFRFTDDEFIGPKPHGLERARQIAHEIIKRRMDIELMIDARALTVEKELFQLLKDAGTIDCLIGIESGVDRILKLYNKGASVSNNIRAIKVIKDLGINLNLAFIMFDPRMNFNELRQNYQFLVDYDIVTIDSLRSWLWPLFGTPLIEQLKSQDLLLEETLCDITYRFIDNSVEAVFNIISHCTRISFPLDRFLFKVRKFDLATQTSLQYMLNKINYYGAVYLKRH
ncbi:MAG: radical SAM protein [Candidatus Magnetoglobus multicellularis str. Araruama]|uniref:Radical SAM protein n=1 Tax=Candidatus Magnetoglobus multicellularis str. Araruama TaxID=890399 RepID=A0A1V1P5X8_9BACT|nr:MAG: radical SAM protein [Candidatus Magnetoglobus multicellularis str. Araruama]